jgi:hypothetical protein
MEKEIWKDVVGYEGLYQVSNLGMVKSLPRKYSPNEKIIRPSYLSMGYEMQKLCNNGFSERILRHRLVAIHFILNPENKPQVNHIDGDKLNNHMSNLEWCTPQENHTHAKENGLKAKGLNSGNSKMTIEKIIKIRELISKGLTQREIAKKMGTCQRVITTISRGETYSDVR